jgi:hypothetical protein
MSHPIGIRRTFDYSPSETQTQGFSTMYVAPDASWRRLWPFVGRRSLPSKRRSRDEPFSQIASLKQFELALVSIRSNDGA